MKKTIFLAIIFMFMGSSLNAQGVVPLKEIPDIITNQNDRIVLTTWESRLDNLRKSLVRIAGIRREECHNQPSRIFNARNCEVHLRDLQIRQKNYNTDARTFNVAVDMAKSAVEYQTGQLTNSEEKAKVELILRALYHGKGDWPRSLGFLNDYLERNPGNRAARRALRYLEDISDFVIWGEPLDQ